MRQYLNYGFTCIGVNNEDRPQCVICLKVLAVDFMLPSKLKRHFETLCPTLVGTESEIQQQK